MKRYIAPFLLAAMWSVVPSVADAQQYTDENGEQYTEIFGHGELTNLIVTNYMNGEFNTNYAVTLEIDNASSLSEQQIEAAFQQWIDTFYMAYQTSGELIAGYPADYTTYYIDEQRQGDSITYLNIFELDVDVPYEDIKEVWQFEDDVANKIQQLAQSDLDKVLYVTDFVQRHYGYSYDTVSTPYSHVAFYKDGYGVCQAYALMTGELLQRLGLEVNYVLGYITHEDGSVEQHAWNLVKLDGQWINIDTTWSDPFYPDKGAASYNYMMSDAMLERDHTREEYNLAQATETKYEVLANYVTMAHDEQFIYAEAQNGTVERFSKDTMQKDNMPVNIQGTNLMINGFFLYYIDTTTKSLKRWNMLTNELEYLAPDVASFYEQRGRLMYEQEGRIVASDIQLHNMLQSMTIRVEQQHVAQRQQALKSFVAQDSILRAKQAYQQKLLSQRFFSDAVNITKR